MSDYPFLVVERCPECGHRCVAVMELVVGTPKSMGGLMRVPFDEVFTPLDACEHVAAAEELDDEFDD